MPPKSVQDVKPGREGEGGELEGREREVEREREGEIRVFVLNKSYVEERSGGGNKKTRRQSIKEAGVELRDPPSTAVVARTLPQSLHSQTGSAEAVLTSSLYRQ